MSSRWMSVLMAVVILAVSGAIFADVPRLITFQGKLADNAGDPLADGSYEMAFYISTDSLAGDLLWDELQTVEVSNGLFNVQLGLGSHLADSIFDQYADLFLSMQVAGVPDELSPRTRLTSSAFAFRARTADVAVSGGGWVNNGTVVHLANTGHDVGIGTDSPQATLDIDGDMRVGSGTAGTAYFNPSSVGNASVNFPENAIASLEILDEPGVGNSAMSGMTLQLDGSWKTIRSRQCTFPAPGYVLAVASCEVLISHVSGINSLVDFGFSSTPGGTPEYIYTKEISGLQPTSSFGEIISIQRLFTVGQETRTIFFQGTAVNVGCEVKTADLTVVYFPTAYGALSTSAAQEGETLEGVGVSGATMEDLIEEHIQMRTSAIRTEFESELTALRNELAELRRAVGNAER